MGSQPRDNKSSSRQISTTGYGQRIREALAGVVGGVVLIAAAFALLWWNEGRAVKTAKGLIEGAAVVTSIDADRIDPVNNGQLVHLSGEAVSRDTLHDPVLGIEQRAIALIREVEMYQWRERSQTETRSRAGGSEERVSTYSYHPEWTSNRVDSSRFHDPSYRNPSAFPVPAETFRAANVTLGEFRLNDALIAQVGGAEPVPLDASHAQRLPERLRERVDSEQPDWLYVGDAYLPEVGDLRIRVRAVGDQTVSLLAQQIDNTFEAHTSHRGTSIQRLMSGTISADAMFSRMESENTMKTWALRFLGVFMMISGFGLILKPIQVVFDVLPLLGSLAGLGTGLIGFVLGLVLSLLTIAFAWLVYRPLLSIVLIALCAAVWLGARRLASRKQPAPVPEPEEPRPTDVSS